MEAPATNPFLSPSAVFEDIRQVGDTQRTGTSVAQKLCSEYGMIIAQSETITLNVLFRAWTICILLLNAGRRNFPVFRQLPVPF
jgi:hypothetical protein